MEKQQLISVLKASFEAGLLMNNESGNILYANMLAQELLFLGHQASETAVENSLEFTDKYKNSISWIKVKHLSPDVTFMVSCKDGKCSAEARLASVGDYSLLFLSPQDQDVSANDASSMMASNVLASILDASLDPIFQVNEEGIIKRVNKAATTQFGWTKQEFLDQNIEMIVGQEHASRHDQYMERYLLTGETHVMGTKRELPARRKDGSEFIIQLSLVEGNVPVKHQNQGEEERMFCGFIVDLTQQKELQSRIESERNLMKGILDASLDPFFQINDKGSIMMVNDAATRQFQWTREEFLGNNISMIVGGEHANRHDEYIQHYLSTGETRVMGTKRLLPARRKDNSEFMIQLSLVEVKHGENERIFCGFILDFPEMDNWMGEAPGNSWCC
jgi:PAS domain S-box-containing protein